MMSFVYGRPVFPGEFIGRQFELDTIFDRISNGESTAVVGEPHIGKTSVLLQIAHLPSLKKHKGTSTKKIYCSLIDLQPISSEYSFIDFWEEALEPIEDNPGHNTTSRRLEKTRDVKYSRTTLKSFFKHLNRSGKRLVLLLDEFDRLLSHPNFKDGSFFATLRSLATITGGLIVVTSSRISVAEMNERGHNLLSQDFDVSTSPFFNNFIEVKLKPFREDAINMLLDNAINSFSLQERLFVQRVAGRHPFLLQAMAGTLSKTQGIGEKRQVEAAESFYDQVGHHFDTLWRILDDETRTTAVILSLMELGGKALGSDFSYGEIEKVDAFGPELRHLEELGLAEKIDIGWKFDAKHALLWHGEQWTIGTQAFTWWVRDVAIAKTRKIRTYEKWLDDKRYRFLLTQQQWTRLIKQFQNAPEFVTRGVGTLARTLIKELSGIK